MADEMTPTEELCAKLDELGIEHENYGYENHMWWEGSNGVGWHAENRPSVNGAYVMINAVLTPEQAIAATVSCIPETKYQMALDDARKARMDAERWERVENDHQGVCESLKETNADLRRIIEELRAATVGAGTCQGEIDSDYFECKLTTFKCHSCGWSGVIDDGYAGYSFGDTDMPRNCPNCGATVGEKQPRLDRPFIDNPATDKRFIWR